MYGCCSSRTFRSWWIAHSAQRQRRGCNNIPSFLQRTAPIARSFCEGFHTARPSYPGHSTISLQSECPSGMCAKFHTVAGSSNRDHPRDHSHIYRCCSSRTFRSWWTAHSAERRSGEVATIVTNSSGERSFSELEMVQWTKEHHYTKQANSLILNSIEHELRCEIDTTGIINEFAMANSRKWKIKQ